MKPTDLYRQTLAAKNFTHDPAQQQIMQKLDVLQQALIEFVDKQHSFSGKLRKLTGKPFQLNGFYIWGGVGRGKTWMMDLFYETLPFDEKYRLHFHRFMQQVHTELDKTRGKRNPLREVARVFADKYSLLCLDEFHVSDITDAMILYGLLKALISEGVCLVITSNLEPDALYQDGLQRERFIPAIDLIKKHTEILHIEHGEDHRLRLMEKAEIYYYPLNSVTQEQLHACFQALVPCQPKTTGMLTINHRPLEFYMLADDIVWFDFNLLFNSPRAVADYIELARLFHTVVISDTPVLDHRNEDKTRRFIQLVDEFYDRKVKLIISAEQPANQIYQGSLLVFEFKRTLSRLLEMQTPAYLSQPHKA